ncbi:hypothetical protein SESBI_42028 [Sesbania bispinosa]|nr:hypothetical protein SESBI_42028 [Sesbania bispinosa]
MDSKQLKPSNSGANLGFKRGGFCSDPPFVDGSDFFWLFWTPRPRRKKCLPCWASGFHLLRGPCPRRSSSSGPARSRNG